MVINKGVKNEERFIVVMESVLKLKITSLFILFVHEYLYKKLDILRS